MNTLLPLNSIASAHAVSPAWTFLLSLARFSEREESPCETCDILSKATSYLMLFTCPFPFPPSHFIFFLTLKRLLTEMLGLTLTHTGPPIRSQLEARRRALAPDLTFDSITAILTVCHGACQGTWKDSDCLTQRHRERAWDLKYRFLLILKSVTLNQQWRQNGLNAPTI